MVCSLILISFKKGKKTEKRSPLDKLNRQPSDWVKLKGKAMFAKFMDNRTEYKILCSIGLILNSYLNR